MEESKILKKDCSKCGRAFRKQDDYLENTSQWRVCSAGNLWFNCDCGSTLMLPRDYYNWYSPELAVRPENRTVFQKFFERNSLPHIPSAVMEVQGLLADPQTEISDLVTSVKSDPLLATEVISAFESKKVVRNIVEGVPSSVGKSRYDLAYAITYIGMNQLASMVMVAAMRKFAIKSHVFNIEDYWCQSRKTGIIAEQLWCHVESSTLKDRAYIAGTLCNIGKLVMAMGYPEKIDQICSYLLDPQTQTTWLNAEKIIGSPDHRVLGEIGAAFWGLPLWVTSCIRGHHSLLDPKEIAAEDRKLVSVVATANIITHSINLEPHRFKMEDLRAHCKAIGLSVADVEQFSNQFKEINDLAVG